MSSVASVCSCAVRHGTNAGERGKCRGSGEGTRCCSCRNTRQPGTARAHSYEQLHIGCKCWWARRITWGSALCHFSNKSKLIIIRRLCRLACFSPSGSARPAWCAIRETQAAATSSIEVQAGVGAQPSAVGCMDRSSTGDTLERTPITFIPLRLCFRRVHLVSICAGYPLVLAINFQDNHFGASGVHLLDSYLILAINFQDNYFVCLDVCGAPRVALK